MRDERILLDHGSGGLLSNRLISELIVPLFDNSFISMQDDGACLDVPAGRMAFSTDSFVVDPIFFPGGCIGDLAVNGTVNDIAMCGGVPRYLSAALIIEEGFPVRDLAAVVQAMAEAARNAGVLIVTGDTKVVPRGAADKLFINTSGVGYIPKSVSVAAGNARPGDVVIASGTLGDHGIAILNQREGLSFDVDIQSDSAPLNHLARRMLETAGSGIHVLRDPTRGGAAAALNEIAAQSKVGIRIRESSVPVAKAVAGLCSLLGLDPLYVANEGKLLAVVESALAERILAVMREDPLGRDACIIGEVTGEYAPAQSGRVIMETAAGGERIVPMPTGEQLPRIC